jgi:hypothetical protein
VICTWRYVRLRRRSCIPSHFNSRSGEYGREVESTGAKWRVRARSGEYRRDNPSQMSPLISNHLQMHILWRIMLADTRAMKRIPIPGITPLSIITRTMETEQLFPRPDQITIAGPALRTKPKNGNQLVRARSVCSPEIARAD